eukprot:jgi/Mesvir1/4175/Mv17196-RA.1
MLLSNCVQQRGQQLQQLAVDDAFLEAVEASCWLLFFREDAASGTGGTDLWRERGGGWGGGSLPGCQLVVGMAAVYFSTGRAVSGFLSRVMPAAAASAHTAVRRASVSVARAEGARVASLCAAGPACALGCLVPLGGCAGRWVVGGRSSLPGGGLWADVARVLFDPVVGRFPVPASAMQASAPLEYSVYFGYLHLLGLMAESAQLRTPDPQGNDRPSDASPAVPHILEGLQVRPSGRREDASSDSQQPESSHRLVAMAGAQPAPLGCRYQRGQWVRLVTQCQSAGAAQQDRRPPQLQQQIGQVVGAAVVPLTLTVQVAWPASSHLFRQDVESGASTHRWRVEPLPNIVVYKRVVEACLRMSEGGAVLSRSLPLWLPPGMPRDRGAGPEGDQQDDARPNVNGDGYGEGADDGNGGRGELNDLQRRAVPLALRGPVALIHRPPGTG